MTDVEGDLYAEDKMASVIVTKSANTSKPKGDHHVFTHFPKDPNCEVSRLTKTTRARCNNTPLKRADEIALGNFVTADQSRNDHALVVQAREGLYRRFRVAYQSVSGPTMDA